MIYDNPFLLGVLVRNYYILNGNAKLLESKDYLTMYANPHNQRVFRTLSANANDVDKRSGACLFHHLFGNYVKTRYETE